jgi:hypothetical protein
MGLCSILVSAGAAQNLARITDVSPKSGAEGTRVEITGENFVSVSSVRFGAVGAPFQFASPEKLIALVPHKAASATITVTTPQGIATSPSEFEVTNDPRVPEEVGYKAGYVNEHGRPAGFRSAMLWGIAIADTRVPGYEKGVIEIASTELSCRVDGKDVILNHDQGAIHGGLYRRNPWFGTDVHESMTTSVDPVDHAVVMKVGERPNKVWHFWAASSRQEIPEGKFEGCTVRVQAKISPGALLQIGMDYWRDTIVGYGSGGNNHEAGASHWYFASPQWQKATFTDVGGVKF